jgi:hypothetical protein
VQAHAEAEGFSITRKRSKPSYNGGVIVKATLLCDRTGFTKRKPTKPGVKARKKGSIKCGCLFRVNAVYKKSLNVWSIDVRIAQHNHEKNDVPDCSAALRRSEKTAQLLDRIDHATRAGMYTILSIAMSINNVTGDAPHEFLSKERLDDPRTLLTRQNVYNAKKKFRKRRLGRYTPTQCLLRALHRNRWFVNVALHQKTKEIKKLFFVEKEVTDVL